MKRATVTTAAVLVLVSSFAGCPSQNPDAARIETGSPDDNGPAVDARLMVTNTLRAACPYFGDDDLAVFVAATEQWRLDGYGLAQVVADYFSGCDAANSGLGSPTCYACGLAVFDQVYADDPELAAVEAMPRPNFDGKWTLTPENLVEVCVEIAGDAIITWDLGCNIAELHENLEGLTADVTQFWQQRRDECSTQSCYDYYQQCIADAVADARTQEEAAVAQMAVTVTSQPFVFSHGVAAWGFTLRSSDGIIRAHSLLIVAGTDPPAGYFDGFPATLTP